MAWSRAKSRPDLDLLKSFIRVVAWSRAQLFSPAPRQRLLCCLTQFCSGCQDSDAQPDSDVQPDSDLGQPPVSTVLASRPATCQTSDSELRASNSDLHVSDSDLAGPAIHHAADLGPNGVTGCGATLNGAVSADGDLP